MLLDRCSTIPKCWSKPPPASPALPPRAKRYHRECIEKIWRNMWPQYVSWAVQLRRQYSRLWIQSDVLIRSNTAVTQCRIHSTLWTDVLHCGKKKKTTELFGIFTLKLHLEAQFWVSALQTAFRNQILSWKHNRNLDQTDFFTDLGCIRLMCVINAWPFSDLKHRWWQLVCYSYSFFHCDDLSNCDTRIQELHEIFSGKKVSLVSSWTWFLPDTKANHIFSLPFPAVWLAANLVLEGCIYIPLTRHDLRDVFSGLSCSLGKSPKMIHCSAAFLILQLAWKTSSRK